jgi:ABC-type transport system involved in multi-copper enzyme maturation permease subunit
MIWLTWRQFRLPALTMFGVLGAVALALLLTEPQLSRDYSSLIAGCGGAPCPEAFDSFFFPRFAVYFGLIALVLAVPLVVGMFWGAPLISREFETGTQDLIWQQSVSRRRWLAVKLGLTGLAAIAAAALAVTMVTWWSRPLDATTIDSFARMSPIVFGARGYAVLGYAAFAFVLGAAAGLLIRRTVPAMAVTFAVFVAVQIIVPTMLRPHLATPASLETVITERNLDGFDATAPDRTINGLRVSIEQPGAWILSSETVDATGRAAGALPPWVIDCEPPDFPADEVVQQQCLDRLAASGYKQVVRYHPAERFWQFQAYETAFFALLSLLLAGFCFWRIRPS